jgi:trigger factor
MESTLQELPDHRVKITVDVPPPDIGPVMDLAYRHLAEQVNVPGFRKGKVPRKLVDTQVGREAVLREFLEHALPTFYVRAIREHELAPIDDPEFADVQVDDVEAQGLRFTATVGVRPRLTFTEADYKGVTIERPKLEVSEREVDEQLDRLRDRFAELEVVGHPARRGDYVIADLRTYIHDQEIPEASGQDQLYEVGSERLVPELDKELEGARRGDILKLNARLPEGLGERSGQEVTIQALVKEVKSKRLPALDDEFAKTASELDTLDELKEDVRKRLGVLNEARSDAALRDAALRALSEKVDVEIPERLLDRETESRVSSARQRAEQQGTTLEAVLAASDVDELQFRSDARSHALRAIRADLALEAVARAEGLQVTEEDLDKVVQALAREMGANVKEIRRHLDSSGQISSLAGDIIRDKALDLVVQHAEVVGEGKKNNSEATEGKA